MRFADLKQHKIGICVSGGLDSKTVTKYFVEAGLDVVCFSADLAQADEKDIYDIERKMAPCGAKTHIIDLKHEMADACFEVIKANASYDGGYWNTTGIARAVTVKGIVAAMKKEGCTVLAHGATGRGNDQMRFERYTKVLAPSMQVYAPWRDPLLLEKFAGRTQMAEYLDQFGIEGVVGSKKRYSTDANLAGLSHEAEDLELLTTPANIVSPTMGVWPQDAPDKVEKVLIEINQGYVVAINGKKGSSLELMLQANDIAGRNGIWMKNALENRIIGTKSRGVYEAPGMELLAFALQQVYQATLDRRASKLYYYLSSLIADEIYDGRYFEPTCQASFNAINTFSKYATAKIELELYKGNMYFSSLTDCNHSLYNEEDSSMEESDGLNPFSSQGYADILSVEACALAKAKQIK